MTRFLCLLFLVPTTLFAQIFTGVDMHGAVVQPRLAFTTTGAALAWNFRGIHVTMEVTHGPVYAENQLLVTSDGTNPALASDGENALVVWNSGGGRPRTPQLDAALVGNAGMIGGVFEIADCDAMSAPDAVWNGTNYVIAWRTAGALHMTMVDRFGNFAGVVHDAAGADDDYHVAVATEGGRSLVVTNSAYVLVDRDATPLSQRAGHGHDVAWSGGGYAVVDSNATGITLERTSADGRPHGAVVTLTQDSGHDPHVVWNGRELEVMWFVDGVFYLRPSVRLGHVGADDVLAPVATFLPPFNTIWGETIWSDRFVYVDNFDIAARPGQTVIARGPAALIAGTISFDIRTTRRRAAGN
jgi:hypothetical protein